MPSITLPGTLLNRKIQSSILRTEQALVSVSLQSQVLNLLGKPTGRSFGAT